MNCLLQILYFNFYVITIDFIELDNTNLSDKLKFFSIPAVKGVEFGSGFHGSTLHGSENNDEFLIKNGKIVTKTNNAGGILGGISTGMPIVLRVAFKPASSISKKQHTVDLKTKKPTSVIVQGRHDPCVVPRAPPVVDSLVSVVLADHAIRAGFIPLVIR